MSTLKWTPGPWRVSWDSRCMDDFDPEEPCWDIVAGKNNLIVDACSVDRFERADGTPYEDEEQDKRDAEITANINLIAAAPDMYGALVLYVEHFGDPLKVARAALAKARGETA
jgi:hypothetical protein